MLSILLCDWGWDENWIETFNVSFSELGNLPLYNLIEEVKRLQNIAYQLGLEETKEMTRGKYLNILRKRTSTP